MRRGRPAGQHCVVQAVRRRLSRRRLARHRLARRLARRRRTDRRQPARGSGHREGLFQRLGARSRPDHVSGKPDRSWPQRRLSRDRKLQSVRRSLRVTVATTSTTTGADLLVSGVSAEDKTVRSSNTTSSGRVPRRSPCKPCRSERSPRQRVRSRISSGATKRTKSKGESRQNASQIKLLPRSNLDKSRNRPAVH